MEESIFLESLVSAWGGDDVSEEKMYPDESDSPNLNLLIRTARKYLDDKVSPAQFLEEVKGMIVRLEQALTEHRALYQVPGITDEVKRVAEEAESAFNDFRAGLGDFLNYFDQQDPSVLEGGIERCKAASTRLRAAYRKFEEIQRRESMARCLMCGQLNQPHLRSCAKCGAVLPDEMERTAATRQETSSDLVMVPPEYMQLYQACDLVASGNLPVEHWNAVVMSFVNSFSQSRAFVEDQLTQQADALGEVAELEKISNLLLMGLADAERALDEMLMFEQDGQVEHLNQGWMDLLKATRKVQEAGVGFYQTLEAFQRAEEEAAQGGGGPVQEAEEEEEYRPPAPGGDQIEFEEE
ncbi:MAG: hypothetical protein AB1758_11620 [Candidatus Eremiobacterota bacterium]